ncbi:hypothetical protein ACFFGH_32575 [Lysobacter korlensis]|uniref:SD-repeat containing protein B domain-containing protein n=1 Tax=Lysobacter korlensis TaxID=553636 RepID=A0ABV6S023_9GAMM
MSVLLLGLGQALASDCATGTVYTTSVQGWPIKVGNTRAQNGALYLAAGPIQAPECNSKLLKDGSYYFQVTDSHTKALVSTQTLGNRRFEVHNGRILDPRSYGGAATACGSATLPLLPHTHEPTSNQLLKVSVTRVQDYEKVCGRNRDCGTRGFVPSRSVTVNAQLRVDKIGVGAVEIFRFYDANANGEYDVGEVEMPHWYVRMNAPHMHSTGRTGLDGTAIYRLLPGTYGFNVTGQKEGNWYESAALVNGKQANDLLSPDIPIRSAKTTLVATGAYCTVPAGRGIDYWLDDGAALIDSSDIASLRSLPLVSSNGLRFKPVNTEQLLQWFTDGGTWDNLSHTLSRSLALAALNVRHGLDPKTVIYPARKTVGTLMAEAKSLIVSDPLVPYGSSNSNAYMEQLGWLAGVSGEPDDDVSAGRLSAKPCGYTAVY